MGHPEPPVAAPAAPPAPPPSRQRKWLPTIAVFVVMMVVTLGGFFAAGSAADRLGDVTDPGTPPPDASPVEVAPGVSLVPLSGWVPAQVGEPYSARLTNGTGYIDVVTNTEASDASALAEAYAVEVLQPGASQLQVGTPEPVAVDAGLPAARLSYVGLFEAQSQSQAAEGEVTAVLLPDGTGVVFDAWASEGLFAIVRDATRQMIGAMTVG